MEEKLQVENVQEAKPSPMPIVEGKFTPSNANELVGLIEKIAKGGGFPSRFKNQEERIAAYNLARSLMGEKWQLALNHIAIIHGQMCIYGELPGAIAEATGQLKEKKVFLIDSEYKEICINNKNMDQAPFAGVCVIQREGRESKEFHYTIEDAKRAAQLPAGSHSPWTKHLKVMLLRKAMNIAVKMEFPDALLGVAIAEHEHDELPEKDVTPHNEYNNVLKERFT